MEEETHSPKNKLQELELGQSSTTMEEDIHSAKNKLQELQPWLFCSAKNKLQELELGQSSSTMEEDIHRTKTLEITEMKDLLIGRSPVDEHHQHCNGLLMNIDIDEENWEPKPECCIYKVPKFIRELNTKVYTPQVVSIGPLHHGKPELASMERYKKKYATSFRERIGPDKWKSVETFVKEKRETILNFYEDTFKFKSHEFEEMVLLDAIFIIEFLLRYDNVDENDVLQHRKALQEAIFTDLQLLENQLPYFLLEKLYTIQYDGTRDEPSLLDLEPLVDLFQYDLDCVITNLEGVDIKHFTDLQRHAWLNPQVLDFMKKGDSQNLPSVTKLHNSGLKLKPIEEYAFGIKFVKRKRLIPLFEVDELHIPVLKIKHNTVHFIHNVMALEQCHYPDNTHFCNFINLLDKVVDTKEDVELLVEMGIIVSFLGDHNATAEMINNFTNNIFFSESCFIDIATNLEKHYQNQWNRAQATLKNVYFSDPWRGTATIAAAILLLLTLGGTICSILQVVYQ